jgi:hypothetical protein
VTINGVQTRVILTLSGLKKQEVTEIRRKLHNEELRNTKYLPNIITEMKQRRTWLAGQKTREGQLRNAY